VWPSSSARKKAARDPQNSAAPPSRGNARRPLLARLKKAPGRRTGEASQKGKQRNIQPAGSFACAARRGRCGEHKGDAQLTGVQGPGIEVDPRLGDDEDVLEVAVQFVVVESVPDDEPIRRSNGGRERERERGEGF